MELLEVLGINLAGVAIFYVLFGLVAKQYKNRLMTACMRLEETEQVIIQNLAKETIRRTQYRYWSTLVLSCAVSLIAIGIYTWSVEPRASFGGFAFFTFFYLGIGLIGCATVLSFTVHRLSLIKAINAYLDQQIAIRPEAAIYHEIRAITRTNKSEVGVNVLSIAAVVGSLLFGLFWLAVFFSVSQSAIACARDPKCL